jgi:hypothetical protein
MLPPGDGTKSTVNANGRTFTCALGSTLDVVLSSDAHLLESHGWTRSAIGGVGTTGQRPAVPLRDQRYLDTTVGFIILWDGFAWRNPLTGASV